MPKKEELKMKLRIVNKGRFITVITAAMLLAANILATIQLVQIGEW